MEVIYLGKEFLTFLKSHEGPSTVFCERVRNSFHNCTMPAKRKKKENNTVIYQAQSGAIELRGDVSCETVWATLDQIAFLFGRDKSVISRHIKNIFYEGELQQKSVVAKNAHTEFGLNMRKTFINYR